MPVTPEEWDLGTAYTPLAKGILSFLRENSPMGYSADEILSLLPQIGHVHEFHGHDLALSVVKEALAGLVANEQIETKELMDETSTDRYYRAVN